ncbi:MAG TPA: kelch repeat-containing protein [Kofleriaceae bacterium]|nr:kelch repeat-containing protein [Kofleriaceae bacterium]
MRAPLLLLVAIALTTPACGGDDGEGDGDGVGADGGADGASAGAWASAAPIGGGPIQETAAVALAGRIYVIGGLSSFAAFTDEVWVFDVAAGTWSPGPDLPRAVHHANAAVVGDTIYVVGALEGGAFTAIGDVWSYRPGVDAAWQPRGTMPAGTQRGSAVVGVIGDTIYLAGGLRGGAAVADVSSYTPATGAWDTTLPALPAPRDHGCGAAIGDRLFVAGGRQASITSQAATLFAYRPGAAWTEEAPMPTARGGTACGVIDGRLYVVGGEGNAASPTGVFPQTEAYDAAAGRWTSHPPMPEPRHGMGAAVWDGALYVPAGATQQAIGPVATHDVFRP